ncbi:Cna protein B-type domain-containing protein [Lentzea jiangxiensis]|uniref:Cna protein B-type domain-containing protein n=1 Tax=Lentzea jiangxiensis TaxID=641025 RepID=A0A1H0NU31_9PSEU|nr:Cna protein B-type domain-containing protein [Lentzea jiangxiensis]
MLKCGAVAIVAGLSFSTAGVTAFAQDGPTPPSAEPSVSGVVYADKNGNGQQDPGEAVEDGVVTVARKKTTTDADGRFSFTNLAPGNYVPSYELPDGWVVHHVHAGGPDRISVTDGVTAEVAVRAERPYSEQLKATATLDRDSYEHPASATVAVELTNTTGRRIDGIQAVCDRAKAGNALAFEFDAAGQTLAAGERRTVESTAKIPQEAVKAGKFTLDCEFAPNAAWNRDGVRLHVEKQVTGGVDPTRVLAVPESRGLKPASLKYEVKFDKPRYESHETVRAELVVTNTGGKAAEQFRVDNGTYDVEIADEQWGDADRHGPGVRIAGGESRTFSLSGGIRHFTGGKLRLWLYFGYSGMPNDQPRHVSASAEVVQTYGDLTGVVHVDRNHNRQQDPGEAAGGVVVEISGGTPHGSFKTETDAEGRYEFENVPSGDYTAGYALDGGWVVHRESGEPQVRVLPGTPGRLTARAERPYTEALKVTTVLDRPVYAVGDDVRITVTLTNKASYALTDVQAGCARDENSWPVNANWGELHEPGLTLAAGETKTVVVSEKVPEEARRTSKVVVHCGFAPWVRWNEDVVVGYDWASVPGGTGTVRAQLAHDEDRDFRADPGELLRGVRVRLMTEPEYGGVVAEAVTNAEGVLVYDRAPAGTYWLQVDGPWRFEGGYTGEVRASPEGDAFHLVFVVPGSPPAPPGTGDTGGHRGGGALARTGASVLGLGLVGALLVAFGLGAGVLGRRSRTA